MSHRRFGNLQDQKDQIRSSLETTKTTTTTEKQQNFPPTIKVLRIFVGWLVAERGVRNFLTSGGGGGGVRTYAFLFLAFLVRDP